MTLGLDISTTRIGLCTTSVSNGMFKSATFKFSKQDKKDDCHTRMLNAFYNSQEYIKIVQLHENKIDRIVIEDSLKSFGRLTSSIATLIEFNAVLTFDIQNQLECEVVKGHPSTIRKDVLGVGRKPKSFEGSTKEFYIKATWEQFGDQCFYHNTNSTWNFPKHPASLHDHYHMRTYADNFKPNLNDRMDAIVIAHWTG